MTILTFLLLTHLIGAVAALTLVVTTWVTIVQRQRTTWKKLAIGLAASSGFQLVSGALLSLAAAMHTGHALSFLSYCQNIGLYLAVMTITQVALARAMRTGTSPFPSRLTYATVLAGLSVVIVVGFVLYA